MKLGSKFLFLIITLLVFCGCGYSDDKIEFLYLPNDITLLPNENFQTRVVLQNNGRKTIEWIQVRFQVPGGISIIKPFREVEMIHPGGRRSFVFNITVKNETLGGEKRIVFWAESEGTILSEKHSFNITVEGNQNTLTTTIATTDLEDTTTTLSNEKIEQRKKERRTTYFAIGFVVLFIFLVVRRLSS
ncbi:MAG: hypothetical protein GF368_05445 [Candidatus Aenigmarchaeota archaeon]|nr:hypothetical protein [Candidatus Aenigmarchaeota archaeon]